MERSKISSNKWLNLLRVYLVGRRYWVASTALLHVAWGDTFTSEHSGFVRALRLQSFAPPVKILAPLTPAFPCSSMLATNQCKSRQLQNKLAVNWRHWKGKIFFGTYDITLMTISPRHFSFLLENCYLRKLAAEVRQRSLLERNTIAQMQQNLAKIFALKTE